MQEIGSRYSIKIVLILLLEMVVLYSCAIHYKLEIKDMKQIEYILEFPEGNTQILSAICRDKVCNFIVFDTFGAPLVSKRFENNEFINTKFLPPNNMYNNLFIQIIEDNGKSNEFSFKIGKSMVHVFKNI